MRFKEEAKMKEGIKTIEAFDDKYFKFGEAFQLKSKDTGKIVNGILLYCEDDRLIFSIVGYANNSNNREAKNLYIRIKDLKTTEIKRLVPEN